jgi:hypothetical protein
MIRFAAQMAERAVPSKAEANVPSLLPADVVTPQQKLAAVDLILTGFPESAPPAARKNKRRTPKRPKVVSDAGASQLDLEG